MVSFLVSNPAGSYRVRVERLFGDLNVSARVIPGVTEAPTAPAAPLVAPTLVPGATSAPTAEALPGEEDSDRNTLIFIIIGSAYPSLIDYVEASFERVDERLRLAVLTLVASLPMADAPQS